MRPTAPTTLCVSESSHRGAQKGINQRISSPANQCVSQSSPGDLCAGEHRACHHIHNEPHQPPTNPYTPTNPPPRIPLHTQRGNNKYRHPSHQHNAESGLTQSSPPCPMPITGELRHITPPPATSHHNRQPPARTTANSRISPRTAARPRTPLQSNPRQPPTPPTHRPIAVLDAYLMIGRMGADTSTECLSPITFGSLMILSTTAFLSFICEASPQMIV